MNLGARLLKMMTKTNMKAARLSCIESYWAGMVIEALLHKEFTDS